jgi:hypothetical protein
VWLFRIFPPLFTRFLRPDRAYPAKSGIHMTRGSVASLRCSLSFRAKRDRPADQVGAFARPSEPQGWLGLEGNTDRLDERRVTPGRRIGRKDPATERHVAGTLPCV